MQKIKGKIGFDESIVTLFDYVKMTNTLRLRDHKLNVGDIVDFENSQTGEIFGQGEITDIEITTIEKLYLRYKDDFKKEQDRREAIEGLNRFYPDHKITESTLAYLYTYKFTPHKEEELKFTEEKQSKKYFCEKCVKYIDEKQAIISPRGSAKHQDCGGDVRITTLFEMTLE